MKSTFSLFITSLIVIVLGYFLTWPAYRAWQSKQQELRAIAQTIRELEEKQKLFAKLGGMAETIATVATTARALIPAEEEREQFVSQFDELSRTLNINLSTITFTSTESRKRKQTDGEEETAPKSAAQKGTTRDSLGKVIFKTTVAGEYGNLKEFLKRARTLNRYLTLTQLSVASNEAGVSAQVEGLIYKKAEPKLQIKSDVSTADWQYLLGRKVPSAAETSPSGRANPFAL